MTTNDVKNPQRRIKVLERRIAHWEGEIVHIQDRIDIMRHEVKELKEKQDHDTFMVETGFG